MEVGMGEWEGLLFFRTFPAACSSSLCFYKKKERKSLRTLVGIKIQSPSLFPQKSTSRERALAISILISESR